MRPFPAERTDFSIAVKLLHPYRCTAVDLMCFSIRPESMESTLKVSWLQMSAVGSVCLATRDIVALLLLHPSCFFYARSRTRQERMDQKLQSLTRTPPVSKRQQRLSRQRHTNETSIQSDRSVLT